MGGYFRDFMRISNYLRQWNRIDQGALDRMYIQGFGNTTRRRIEHRLSIMQPDHHPDNPYPQSMVQEAAQFLLSSTSPLSSSFADQKPTVLGPTSPTLEIKTEPTEMGSLMSVMQQMVGSLTMLTQQVTAISAQRNPGTGPATGQSNSCHFCGKTACRVKICETVNEYVAAGKCAKDQNGRITLPSGGWLPRGLEGTTMAQRIDNYHSTNPGQLARNPAPRVTAAMFESVESLAFTRQVEEEGETEKGEIEEFVRVMANEAAKRFDKGKKKNPVPKVVITTPASPQAPQPAATTQQTTPETTPAKPATRGEPQFHFQSPCDDPALVGKVWDRTLDTPIMLTQWELLTVSVDIRKKFKDHTTAKQVPANMTGMTEVMYQQTGE